MNERIKQLALQAEILITEAGAFHNTPQGAYQLQEQHMNKFAELIVRECAEVAHCNFHVDGVTLGNIMKEHFGVEE
jgi:hypothetical protein